MTTNREVFDSIATSWYGFRHWPLLRDELDEMAERWGSGRLINLGCAHGADFLPFSGRFELTGLDFSSEMLRNSRTYMGKHGFAAVLVQGDLQALPIKTSSFDYAVAVASYHHIAGERQRHQAFHELQRILRPGGEAFLTVWNHGQLRFRDGPQDLHVPWRSGTSTLERFYHLYRYDELREMLQGAALDVLRMEPERHHQEGNIEASRNICALVKKRDK